MKKIFYALVAFWLNVSVVFADPATETSIDPNGGFSLVPTGQIKGCNFVSGEMSFECIPNYIKYLIDIIVGLAATIAVVFVMVGAFKYIFSGFAEDKEGGKKTIQDALIGLIITGMAWIIVTGLVSLLTS